MGYGGKSWGKGAGKWGGNLVRKQIEKDTSGGILGEVKGTIEKRGPKFGFIETKKYGQVFVLADELKAYQAGQVVKFTVFTDETGGFQAKDLKSGLTGDAATKSTWKPSAGKGGGKQWKHPKDTSNGVLGESTGTIAKRGNKFGFIESAEFGQVFVLADELKSYQQGQIIKFTAFTDESGGVQAKDLKSGLKDGNTTKTKPFAPVKKFAPVQARWGQGGSSSFSGSRQRKPKDTSNGVLGPSEGTIAKRGGKFGFIDSEEHGQVFVLGDELKAYQAGQHVKFTAFTDETGGVQAKDLKSGLR